MTYKRKIGNQYYLYKSYRDKVSGKPKSKYVGKADGTAKSYATKKVKEVSHKKELSKEAIETRKKMIQAIDTQFRKYPEKVKCPSIQKMVEYIKEVHPDLDVKLSDSSCYKTTKPAGYTYTTGGGKREYCGKRLIVTKGDKNIIDHDTTETYRYNTDVATEIIRYEESI